MSVPVEKQIIVNFDPKFFQGNWEDTYRALLPKRQQFEDMHAPLLRLYVARTSTRRGLLCHGRAAHRRSGPLTIEQLQHAFVATPASSRTCRSPSMVSMIHVFPSNGRSPGST